MIKPNLGRVLLFFWSSYLSIVLATNLTDGMRAAGLGADGWPFVSGNFDLIARTIEIYGLPVWMAALLFAAVLVIQLGAAVLFWRAFLDPTSVTAPGNPKAMEAFSVSIALFAAFVLADEVFIVYERFPGLETTHLLVFCALLVSIISIYVLRSSWGEPGEKT